MCRRERGAGDRWEPKYTLAAARRVGAAVAAL
jgi:hypothetical protein